MWIVTAFTLLQLLSNALHNVDNVIARSTLTSLYTLHLFVLLLLLLFILIARRWWKRRHMYWLCRCGWRFFLFCWCCLVKCKVVVMYGRLAWLGSFIVIFLLCIIHIYKALLLIYITIVAHVIDNLDSYKHGWW